MSNYDVDELPSYMPKYYLTPFQKWSKLSSKMDSIKGQCLLYNKGIKVGKKKVCSAVTCFPLECGLQLIYSKMANLFCLKHGNIEELVK